MHHVWVKKYAITISSLNYTLLTSLCCLIGFFILLPIYGIELVTEHTTNFWLAVFGIGCFGTALAYFLWQKGVQAIGADKAGIYMNIVPLSAAIFAILFMEKLYPYHLFGGLFIVIGLFISKNSTSKFLKALS